MDEDTRNKIDIIMRAIRDNPDEAVRDEHYRFARQIAYRIVKHLPDRERLKFMLFFDGDKCDLSPEVINEANDIARHLAIALLNDEKCRTGYLGPKLDSTTQELTEALGRAVRRKKDEKSSVMGAFADKNDGLTPEEFVKKAISEHPELFDQDELQADLKPSDYRRIKDRFRKHKPE